MMWIKAALAMMFVGHAPRRFEAEAKEAQKKIEQARQRIVSAAEDPTTKALARLDEVETTRNG